MKRQTAAVVSALVLLAAGVYAADERPLENCSPDAAEREGYRIDAIRRPTDLPEGFASNLAPGQPFSTASLDAEQEALDRALEERDATRGAARFHLNASTVTCHAMNTAAKTVDIEIRVDHLVVPEGNTAGEVLDESSRSRTNDIGDAVSLNSRTDYDRSVGQIVGVSLAERGTGFSNGRGLLAASRFGGWKSVNEPYYSLTLDADLTSLLGDPRTARFGGQTRLWFEKLPFANTVLATKGISEGWGVEAQRGVADLRAIGSVSFSANALEGEPTLAPLAAPSHHELAIHAAGQQEFTIPGGFVRASGWADRGHRFGEPLTYNRAGAAVRLYEDVAVGRLGSVVVDLAGHTGISGAVPLYRTFTGGNRLDPFLAERTETVDEMTWQGPMIRGFGISSLMLPFQPGRADVAPAERYGGLSVTLGLPGYTRLLVDRVDADQKKRLDAKLQEAFDRAIADMMARKLDQGASVQKAAGASRREGLELRRALDNLIRHARSFSARPLIAFDVGHLGSDVTGATAWSAGGGFRLAAMSWTAEALFFQNHADAFATGLRSVDHAVVVRFNIRTGLERFFE